MQPKKAVSPKTAQVAKDMAAKETAKQDLVRADDQIDIQPMRACGECWECYACTHDEHYGNVGNCVPILGCEPTLQMNVCSGDNECDGGRKCYYGECRDTCSHSSDCSANASGDLCQHGLCGMFYLFTVYNPSLSKCLTFFGSKSFFSL